MEKWDFFSDGEGRVGGELGNKVQWSTWNRFWRATTAFSYLGFYYFSFPFWRPRTSKLLGSVPPRWCSDDRKIPINPFRSADFRFDDKRTVTRRMYKLSSLDSGRHFRSIIMIKDNFGAKLNLSKWFWRINAVVAVLLLLPTEERISNF